MKLRKIISGGQTGVDRGALDAAIGLGLEHGGYCPKGRRAEDGRIPDHYMLEELGSRYYTERTKRNVLEADATLLVTQAGIWSPGTQLTARIISNHRRLGYRFTFGPKWENLNGDFAGLCRWLEEHEIKVLNVAGPRESRAPGIQGITHTLLCAALTEAK